MALNSRLSVQSISLMTLLCTLLIGLFAPSQSFADNDALTIQWTCRSYLGEKAFIGNGFTKDEALNNLMYACMDYLERHHSKQYPDEEKRVAQCGLITERADRGTRRGSCYQR